MPVSKSVQLIVPSEEAVYSIPSLALSILNKVIMLQHFHPCKRETDNNYQGIFLLHTVQNAEVHRIICNLLMQLNIIPNTQKPFLCGNKKDPLVLGYMFLQYSHFCTLAVQNICKEFKRAKLQGSPLGYLFQKRNLRGQHGSTVGVQYLVS